MKCPINKREDECPSCYYMGDTTCAHPDHERTIDDCIREKIEVTKRLVEFNKGTDFKKMFERMYGVKMK